MGKPMRSASLTLLAVSLGCAGPLPFEPAGPEAAPDPALHGPYAVGVRTVDLRDATRPNAETGEPRRLLTEVWYPAAEEARDQPGAVYTLADVLNPRAIATASITATVELGTEAVRDAAPYREGDGDGDAFPVVFFSHGSNGIRMQSLYLMTYLASHGYVVISPDHEGNVLSDLLTDNGIPDAGLAAGLFFLRADDVRFLMEHFRALPAGDSLAGLLDFTRVGVAGHSFGALTAVRVAGLSDPGHPVHMAIAQAPPKFGLSWLGVERPLSQVGAALMIQGGELDDTTPVEDARTYWPEAARPRMELILATAGHFTFSDLCRLDPVLVAQVVATGVGDALGDGCGPNNIAPEEAYGVLRHYTIGALNHFLRRSPGSAEYLTEDAVKALSPAPLTFRAEL